MENETKMNAEQIIKDAIFALNWAIENTSPIRTELQSDHFNILVNAHESLKSLHPSEQGGITKEGKCAFKNVCEKESIDYQKQFCGCYNDACATLPQQVSVSDEEIDDILNEFSVGKTSDAVIRQKIHNLFTTTNTEKK